MPMRNERGPSAPDQLTRREAQVLALCAQGLGAREIAARLCVSKRTIDYHLSNILPKSGARTTLAALAARGTWTMNPGMALHPPAPTGLGPDE